MSDPLTPEAIERLAASAREDARDWLHGCDVHSRALTTIALIAAHERHAALMEVAEKFRAWTETPPNTQEESDALHEAAEALGSYDAWKASNHE